MLPSAVGVEQTVVERVQTVVERCKLAVCLRQLAALRAELSVLLHEEINKHDKDDGQRRHAEGGDAQHGVAAFHQLLVGSHDDGQLLRYLYYAQAVVEQLRVFHCEVYVAFSPLHVVLALLIEEHGKVLQRHVLARAVEQVAMCRLYKIMLVMFHVALCAVVVGHGTCRHGIFAGVVRCGAEHAEIALKGVAVVMLHINIIFASIIFGSR